MLCCINNSLSINHGISSLQVWQCMSAIYLLEVEMSGKTISIHLVFCMLNRSNKAAYHQTFYASRQMLSSYCGCSSRPCSQTPVCSAGWVCPPSLMCSRCIPEDRHAGAHLRETRDTERHFYTHHWHWICAFFIFFPKRMSWVFDQNSPVIWGLSSLKLSERDRA